MSTEIKKTLKMLKKLPMYKELKRENKELVERIRSLEYAVNYLESKNAKLEKKLSKKQTMNPIKIEPTKSNYGIINLTEEDDDDDNDDNVVLVIEEADAEEEEVLKQNTLDELLAKYPEYQTHKEVKEVVEEIVEEVVLEVVEENKVVIEIVEEEEEEEVVVEEVVVEEEEEEEEEEVVVEEVVVEEEEEEVVVEEEEEEVVEEEEVEEEVVEEEVVEEEVVEEEEEEEVEEEEEDVYEIQINGKTYYVTNEIDSTIYEADEEGEITIEAGAYKNGKPVFN